MRLKDIFSGTPFVLKDYRGATHDDGKAITSMSFWWQINYNEWQHHYYLLYGYTLEPCRSYGCAMNETLDLCNEVDNKNFDSKDEILKYKSVVARNIYDKYLKDNVVSINTDKVNRQIKYQESVIENANKEIDRLKKSLNNDINELED